MSSIVLPSAPEYGDAETQSTLYPVLPYAESKRSFKIFK